MQCTAYYAREGQDGATRGGRVPVLAGARDSRFSRGAQCSARDLRHGSGALVACDSIRFLVLSMRTSALHGAPQRKC